MTRRDKRLGISPSLPSESCVHACVHLYADTWLIFYPVTRFLSPRLREQTDSCVMIKLCSWRQQKIWFASTNISPCVFFFFIPFHSSWLSKTKAESFFPLFVSQMCTYATSTHIHTYTSLPHTHTRTYLPFVPPFKTNGRGLSISSIGAVQIPAQWDWLMSPGKQKENCTEPEYGERRRGQVALSNPPPGWPRVKSSDTGN